MNPPWKVGKSTPEASFSTLKGWGINPWSMIFHPWRWKTGRFRLFSPNLAFFLTQGMKNAAS
jgi:hypothetical protein